MLEEGEMDSNGKLFKEKLEEGNGGLRYRKSSLKKGPAGRQGMRRQGEAKFCG